MRIPVLATLIVGAVMSLAAAEPVALVTAYGPFAGRGVNGSETVAKRLDGTLIAGTRIVVRVLPVRWGEPDRVLPEVVETLKPVLLVGLGEGFPGRVAVERLGRNRASGADEAGSPPPDPLEPLGPAERRATLAFAAEWFPSPEIPVQASEDAGAYLCNALLYRACALPVAKVGFVHLPPQGATPDDAYAASLVPIIRTLLERNLTP